MENSEKSQNRGLSEVVIKDLRILASSFCILLFLVGINSIFQNLFAVKESVSEVVIPRPLSSQEITHGDQTKNQVIFTFDGGSGSESGKAILDTYKKHNIKATFFLTGKFVEENPELVRSMVAGGHEIFNHTYDHPHLDEISDQEIIVEFEKMDQVLTRTVGISSKPFFRPPYGSRDQRVLDIAYKAGYQSV